MRFVSRLAKLPPWKWGACCGMWFLALAILQNTSAAADDIDRQIVGAWAEAGADCKDVFVAEAGELKFREPRDMYGSSFVVSGRRIVGPFGVCQLLTISRKEDKAVLNLSCHNSVGYADQSMPVRLNTNDELELFFPSLPDLSQKYQRCVP